MAGSIIGDRLPGAQGKSLSDQDRIDETVARGCGGGVYGKAQCQRHTRASAERRTELRGGE